jgi:hypothetical protein
MSQQAMRSCDWTSVPGSLASACARRALEGRGAHGAPEVRRIDDQRRDSRVAAARPLAGDERQRNTARRECVERALDERSAPP